MTDIASMFRNAADLAERGAVKRQHAELDGLRSAPAIIGGLELTADALRYAAAPFGPPPVASRRAITTAALMICVQTISTAAVLLAVPNPAHPLVLAATVAGTGVLAELAGDLLAAIRDRRAARTLASAINEPQDAQNTIAELRTRIGAITRALEPDRNDLHQEFGRRIESAQVWLDSADYALAETPER